jgi:uncharacterized membrane protein
MGFSNKVPQIFVRVDSMAEQLKSRFANRFAYIDWVRGLACVMMFQTHCYDAWLGGPAREGQFLKLSQLGGTLPAPLFLFLSGVSIAIVTDNLRRKGTSANVVARTTILRGGQIFLLALLLRLQEFLLGYRSAHWTDLLRVDVLNVIGLSLILMGVICRVAALGGEREARRLRISNSIWAIALAAAIALATPPMWTTWRPHWRAWWLESYLNGVHVFDQPQAWLFPIFPWAAFAFAGLGVGFFMVADRARANVTATTGVVGSVGLLMILAGKWLDARSLQAYAVYDFWHTSPDFFLIRVGVVMVILWIGYLWCRWGAGQRGFSPLIEMGKCSLLVYWVHLEFVYGGFSILPKRGVDVTTATFGLVAIFLAMTLLAVAWNSFSGGGGQLLTRMRHAFQTSSGGSREPA